MIWHDDGGAKAKEDRSDRFVVPPQTIGILGGGQLGRMLALEAREMGYGIVTLDPTPNAPTAQVADGHVVAAYTSEEGAQELSRQADVITYEFENVGANIAALLEQHSHLPQGYKLLHTTQHRLREKQAIETAGGSVAPFRPVGSPNDVDSAAHALGLPFVLKTCQGGYDGKGQLVVRTEQNIAEAKQWISEQLSNQTIDQMSKRVVKPTGQRLGNTGKQSELSTETNGDDNGEQTKSDAPWVAEQFISFEKEISVIVARNERGDVQTFPVAENIHRDNILHVSIAPARVSDDVKQAAEQMAVKLATHFQLVGLLAIEMFLLPDETIYVNELAPRPHNSGHYTQQACLTSQFEQHVRAVCNLPLAAPTIVQPTVMVNILGEHLPHVLEQVPHLGPEYKLHVYGKKDARAKRKMGHLNVVADTTEIALQKIEQLHIWDMEGIR